MDLTEPIARANVARHLAALANYGGGFLVFGFCKDGTVDPAPPTDLNGFNHDAIAGIVDRYLDPPFHCYVTTVRQPGVAADCVAVRVPSRGSIPVCAKAGGPQDKQGRQQGISIGRYYTRVNGPKSEEIRTPAQWAPLIRRCVLYERQSLLDNIASLLRTSEPGPEVSVESREHPTPKVEVTVSADGTRRRARMGAWKPRDSKHSRST